MRRDLILTNLTLLFVLGGAIALGTEFQALKALASVSPLGFAGVMFVGLSAIASLLAMVVSRRTATRLADDVKQTLSTGRLQGIECQDRLLVPLVSAVNAVIDQAEQAINEASVQVKELQIQLKVATSARRQAEAIIHSISDAVLVTDPFDEVLLANEAAARTFDFELACATRRPLDQLIKEPGLIELIREMRQSRSTSGRRIVEYTLKHKRPERTFKAMLSCVGDSAGAPAGVVTVLHDMTKEREVADMKNDFVSSVSHELRTPLASIKAYVEMLIDGEADDEKTTREFYEVIQNEANRLSRLIDNILNISRIESGLVKVNKQPLSLTVILKEALEVIAPQARMKRIKIEENLTPVFYQTQADRDMIYQAVLNLLSNAVKYTPEDGTITVSTSVDETQRIVRAWISDTGVGIPPKDLPFVFDKFYRSEANNRMAKGTGLGLSLVKHIVETVHHGRIFVESQVGKGSTFGFELNLCD